MQKLFTTYNVHIKQQDDFLQRLDNFLKIKRRGQNKFFFQRHVKINFQQGWCQLQSKSMTAFWGGGCSGGKPCTPQHMVVCEDCRETENMTARILFSGLKRVFFVGLYRRRRAELILV